MASPDVQRSSGRSNRTERRRAPRPRNGDTRPCPCCAHGRLEFNERWRGGSEPRTPAWVCVRCDRAIAVRSQPLTVAAAVERTITEHGLFEALRCLNDTTEFRFTGVYRFEAGIVKSVALFDKKNAHLRIGADVPWRDSYCRMAAEDGDACRIDGALTDARLTTHAARESVQSYAAVLLRSADGTAWGTLCQFDVCPRAADDQTIAVLKQVRPVVEGALHLLTRPPAQRAS